MNDQAPDRPVDLEDLGDILWDIRRHTRMCAIVAIILLIPAAIATVALAAGFMRGLSG